MHYEMKTKEIFIEGKEYTAFGIAAVDGGKVVLKFTDVFLNRTEAEKFVKLCNDLKLDVEQLRDVVEDVIGGK